MTDSGSVVRLPGSPLFCHTPCERPIPKSLLSKLSMGCACSTQIRCVRSDIDDAEIILFLSSADSGTQELAIMARHVN
jgi:hypothetical protein